MTVALEMERSVLVRSSRSSKTYGDITGSAREVNNS
jgi:hypothetical protein